MLCDSGEDENIFIFLKIFVLLFADDTVLFSNTKEDLQIKLNIFENYCTAWKLSVNTSKTNIKIFSGGRLAKDQKFYFNGYKLDTLSEYKYLGILLARSGAFAKAKKHIIDQANSAPFSLQRKIRSLNLLIDIQIEIFNKTIRLILLYGCEIWGYGNLATIERVQLKFLKQILNLKKKTPSFMVYGEAGDYLLFIDIQTRIISFWTKLGDNGTNDTAITLHKVIYYLREKRLLKSTWLDNIKHLIYSNGFGHVWESHNEMNRKWFVEAVKQKLKDQYKQTWSSLVEQSSSDKNYRIFNDSFEIHSYFSCLNNRESRLLTAFRTGNYRLPIETGRWASIPLNERTCGLWIDDRGDEFHYIMRFSYLGDLRKKFVKPYLVYRKNVNILKFNK